MTTNDTGTLVPDLELQPCNSSQRARPITRWAAHLADDVDPIVVERLVRGIPVAEPPTTYERGEAVRQLRETGRSYLQIASHLGVDVRQVGRDLDRLGLVQHRQAS